MLTKIGLAALVGTVATAAFAAPASADEHGHDSWQDRGGYARHDGGEGRGYWRGGDRRDDRMERWGRWEHQRRVRFWHDRDDGYGYRVINNPYWYGR